MGTVAVLSRAEFSGVGTASDLEFPGRRLGFPGIWPGPFILAAPPAAAALQTAEWLLSADLCLNPWPQDAHRKGTTSAAVIEPFPGS